MGGFALLVVGVLPLLVGGWLSAGLAPEFDFWLVILGVVIAAISAFAGLLAQSPTAPTAATSSEAPKPAPVEVVRELFVPELSDRLTSAVAPAAEPPPPEPPPSDAPPSRLPVTTSIPGAYLASLGSAPSTEAVPWENPAPPIAASLPFAAMQRGAETTIESRGSGTEGESIFLEVELARLRARVRELENAPPRAPVEPAPSLSTSRSGASRAVPTFLLAAEPPKPAVSLTGSTRACVGCGTIVPAQGPDQRCGSCGRLLCTTCYWRFGTGAGLQRCPDCRRAFEESGRTSVSGGRSGPATLTGPSTGSAAPFR